uniref:Uncharacterized protein n=1 Tax=Rhizophora mucronata TaxID=61149 RepID=A0A2P2PGU8_RHIMU
MLVGYPMVFVKFILLAFLIFIVTFGLLVSFWLQKE